MDGTAVACALLAAAAYYNTLDAGFVYDDRRAILGNPDVTGNETSLWRLATSDFWGTPLRLAGSHGSWRPLTVLSFRANHLLGGGWHAANAALHALCTALLVGVARRLGASAPVAGAAFALHPVHCEAVAGLVGRADAAAAACALLALLCYARHAELRDNGRRCGGCGVPLQAAGERLSCQRHGFSPPAAADTCHGRDAWLGKRPALTPDATLSHSNDANNNTSPNAHTYRQSPCKTAEDSNTSPSNTDMSETHPQKSSHTTCCDQSHTKTSSLPHSLSTEGKQNGHVTYHTDATRDANHNNELFTSPRLVTTNQWSHHNGYDHPHLEEKVVRRSLFKAKREASSRIGTNMLRRRWKKCFKDKNLIADSGGDQKRLLQAAERHTCGTADAWTKDEFHSCRSSPGPLRPLPSLLASVLLGACALLCKETGVAALAVCVAYDVALLAERGVGTPRQLLATRRGRRALLSLAVASASLAALAGARLALAAACGGGGGGAVPWSAADNPASRAPRLLTRALSLLHLPAFCWLRLLLCPTALCFDWGMSAVPLLHSPLEPRAAAAAAFYAALAVALHACLPHRIAQRAIDRRRLEQQVSAEGRHRRPPSHSRCCRRLPGGGSENNSGGGGPRGRGALLVSLSLLVVPFLPASNVSHYVGFAAAERVLYLPSAGHCLLVGLGWQRLSTRAHRRHHQHQHQHRHHWRWLSGFALAATLASFGARTVLRNRDWHDEESLFRSALHINPPKAYGNLGCVLSSAGRLEEAEWALRQALKHRPNMADVHYNLGNLLQARGRPEEAERSYRLAIHFRPSLAAAYVALGQLLEARGRLVEAAQAYEGGARLGGERLRDPAAHLGAALSALLRLAGLRARRGEWAAAAEACRQALARHQAATGQGLATQIVEPLVEEARERLEKFQQMLGGRSKTPELHAVAASTELAAAAAAGAGRRRRAAGAA